MHLSSWNMSEDFTRRFDKRAAEYSKYRPSYPPGILTILGSEIRFSPDTIVADIGSGTGLLSKLFLQNGNIVHAVEPNDQMRSFAEQDLSSFPRFHSIRGRAEHTTLRDASVDLVAVGQALHWFDPQLSTREFSRILRSDGSVLIAYNDRNRGDPVMRDYEAIITKHERDRASVPDVNDDYISKFFQDGRRRVFTLPNEQFLDSEGLSGRLASASYMPSVVDEKRFEAMKADVSRLFETWQESGRVRLLYDTVISLRPVRRLPY